MQGSGHYQDANKRPTVDHVGIVDLVESSKVRCADVMSDDFSDGGDDG